jgi:putative MATE family efflux protein
MHEVSVRATAPKGRPSLWRAVREAIAGTQHDLTEVSLERAIFLLAVPMMLEMCMESLFGVVDMFWVARLGADAMATVGLTESLLNILFAVALGFGMACTALVARRIGEKNKDAAAIAAVQAIVLSAVFSALTGAFGFIYADDLLRLMGGSDEVVRIGTNYTRTILAGSITIFELFVINAIFRGAGDAAFAMRVLWLANGVNIVLNPFLIFGIGPFPKLGVLGSAVGTTVGRGTGVLFALWVLTNGSGRIAVHWGNARIDVGLMWRLLRLSFGAVFQFLVQMASWVGVNRIIASFGSVAVAANTLAIRVIIFTILPSWGLANAAATLVGQNLGARKPERAERAVWRAALYNMLLLGSIGIFFIIFAERVIGIFTSDPQVFPLAASALRFFSYGYLSYSFGMVISQAFNGAGDTFTPTVLNIICFWVCQLPLAYFLSVVTGMGTKGVYFTVVFSDTLLAIFGILWFRRGTWKRQVV